MTNDAYDPEAMVFEINLKGTLSLSGNGSPCDDVVSGVNAILSG